MSDLKVVRFFSIVKEFLMYWLPILTSSKLLLPDFKHYILNDSICIVHKRSWPKLWENRNRMDIKYNFKAPSHVLYQLQSQMELYFVLKLFVKDYSLPYYKPGVILTIVVIFISSTILKSTACRFAAPSYKY